MHLITVLIVVPIGARVKQRNELKFIFIEYEVWLRSELRNKDKIKQLMNNSESVGFAYCFYYGDYPVTTKYIETDT